MKSPNTFAIWEFFHITAKFHMKCTLAFRAWNWKGFSFREESRKANFTMWLLPFFWFISGIPGLMKFAFFFLVYPLPCGFHTSKQAQFWNTPSPLGRNNIKELKPIFQSTLHLNLTVFMIVSYPHRWAKVMGMEVSNVSVIDFMSLLFLCPQICLFFIRFLELACKLISGHGELPYFMLNLIVFLKENT